MRDEEELAPGGRVYKFKQNLDKLHNVRLGDLFTEATLKDTRELLDLIPNGNRLVSDTPAELYAETAIRLVACSTDDIDHLENKRVRSVGELLQDQLRMGFLRMEKVAKERMTSLDPGERDPAGYPLRQADLREHQELLRIEPVVAVYGPDQPARRAYA